MAWKMRMRKRVKIAPGVNLNLSPSGVGASVGNKYGRVRVSPGGRVTSTQSIPGAGIAYQHTVSSAAGGKRQQAAPAVVLVPVRQPPQFVLRLLYCVAIGWWLTLAWWALAALLMCTIIGIPVGLRMFRATSQVLTLG